MRKSFLLLSILPLLCCAQSLIDRQTVLQRNNPVVTAANPLESLTVGNGRFAATVDITGLQSYPEAYSTGIPLDAMSEWGWHSYPNTLMLKPEETRRTFHLHGRDSEYAVEYKDDSRNRQATEYFRVNPHRLNLGALGLHLTYRNGSIIPLDSLTDIKQTLNLWDGTISSQYRANYVPVDVVTAVNPSRDCMFSRISTKLLSDGQATVTLKFPYPTGQHADDASDWTQERGHSTFIVENGKYYAIIERTIDDTRYYATIQCSTEAKISLTKPHHISILTDTDDMTVAVEYTLDKPIVADEPFDFEAALAYTADRWQGFWQRGGFVDFSECTDPRAPELERRVVLSQYLTRVNCANSMPPQETGLTYNSWFGRPHLEMTWWHAVDFALWGHPQVVETMLQWYNDVAYPEAKAIAQRQGFDGVRWMKMTDPWAGEAPSNTGSFLIWQQPHYIYLAEEIYRAHPTQSTLDQYGKYVEETAQFMADYAKACEVNGKIKLFGQTAMQESMSKDFSYYHPFEQAYWLYGLQTAQKWRERQDLPRNTEWDEIILSIAPLSSNDKGIYVAGEPLANFIDSENGETKGFDPYSTPDQMGRKSLPKKEFELKSRSDHPAVLGACGLLPDTTLYDKETMTKTLDWVMTNWNWDTTWGWDYGMIAMAAARLGRPETAIDALLIDKGKNTYLINGHNYQEPKRLHLYLPGNGALLDAVAMMCAGWTGSEGVNPGFPADGTWNVRWEGIKPMQ